MKVLFAVLVLTTFTAQASPLMNVKERLRLHMWTFGITEKPKLKQVNIRPLPEEIERPLRKL